MRHISFLLNDTATTQIYTLSLHDALPISHWLLKLPSGFSTGPSALRTAAIISLVVVLPLEPVTAATGTVKRDRKSTRLNSSHVEISYAVFCLKKKTTN